MSSKRVMRFAVLLCFSLPLWAGTITDPAMAVDEGAFSDPITGASVFSPVNGGGVFGFYNATGLIINKLVFQTQILPGISQSVIDAAFNCGSGANNPFFLYCSVNYAPVSGLLSISFFGTNPPDGDELPTDAFQENEVGEQQGIPPLLFGCESTPDADGCRDIGHFIITLNDNFLSSGASGGWSFSANPTLFPVGGPSFSVLEIGTAPEPSTYLLFGSALVGLGFMRRKSKS